ncbi:polysaccharide pyruvyl transferase [Bryobacterales bacterium F-183]|nr:polysaccharide pyruvyl transferase [Bryobacterales bacterium F-183]
MQRRAFFLTAALGFAQATKKTPQVLLRSSWQSVNIGDIGHTPGALAILDKHFPEAEITLWPGKLGHGSRELLLKGYPKLKIVEGSVGADGKPTTPELAAAWARADLYLSGSGSGFPASAHAVAFRKATGKPVGVFGVSTDPVSGFGGKRRPEGGTLRELHEAAVRLPAGDLDADLRYIIDQSSFFYCRDTISRDYLRAQKVKTPILEFGPDAQLGMSLRDDAKGFAWLKAHGLEDGKFLCVVPRLRYTPYYRVDGRPRAKDDDAKDAINDRTTEQDHAKLRDMIIRYVKATGNKVMVCAEMTYQVELGKQVLVDPLPEDVRAKVVWRDTYWLPDEAASIYSKAQAVVSVECHSPLIAMRNGTPAIYVRQPTDTCKGQMYRDFGSDDWFFEVDETNGEQLWSALEKIHGEPRGAKAQVRLIMKRVDALQAQMADAARRACKV